MEKEKKPLILIVGAASKDMLAVGNILREEDYEIAVSQNGREALTMVKSRRFDLILLDVLMLGMDGYEVCEHLREDPETKEIPVIFLSAKADADSIVKGFEVGGQDYVTKPFDPAELLARVHSHLKLKKNRDMILKINEQLKREIRERKQTEGKQLQLINELESANEDLKDFACIVTHDLKAPLRIIYALAEWISTDYSDKLDEEGKERLGLLRNRVERMQQLIDGILHYSRVGRVKEEKEEANLNRLVSEVIDMINPPEDIEIEVVNQLPTIYCEKTRIEEVFQNLLSNAVRYMDKPKGKITIGCTEKDGYWKFSVADNGPGIEEKHYGRIFQIFQTLKPRGEVESTGVGLTIVKKIVEMYGGEIWVESKVGEGSTFFFTVPKATEDADYGKKKLQTYSLQMTA